MNIASLEDTHTAKDYGPYTVVLHFNICTKVDTYIIFTLEELRYFGSRLLPESMISCKVIANSGQQGSAWKQILYIGVHTTRHLCRLQDHPEEDVAICYPAPAFGYWYI